MSPKKKFRPEDWDKISRRMERAKALLETKPSEDDLDDIVRYLWTCGEYLINVCLELKDQDPATDHSQHKSARDLKARGDLQGDYHQSLEKLQRFRKKADYLSYSKGNRSVHYNRPAVEVCFNDIKALLLEVQHKLKAEGVL